MKNKSIRLLVGALGVGFGAFLLYNVFSHSDIHSAAALLSSLSTGSLALILLPASAGAAFDAIGWRYLLPQNVTTLRFRTAFWRILRVRMASETVVSTVPMGAIIADPLKAWLLKRYFGLSLACASASVALRTFLLASAQALLVVIVTLVSFNYVSGVSTRISNTTILYWIILGAGLLGFVLYTLLVLSTTSGTLSKRLILWLSKIRIKKVRQWLTAQESHLADLQKELSSFGKDRRRLVVYSFVCYLATWSMEGVETYLIFQFIGLPLSFVEAFTLEAICLFIRSISFMIPSGLGAQDAGYVAFLTQAGEAQAVALAFVLLKRVRQLLWILFGAVFLFKYKRSPQATTA